MRVLETLASEGSTMAGRFYWKRVSEPMPQHEAFMALISAMGADATTQHRLVEAK